jgi:hypothetical protein
VDETCAVTLDVLASVPLDLVAFDEVEHRPRVEALLVVSRASG